MRILSSSRLAATRTGARREIRNETRRPRCPRLYRWPRPFAFTFAERVKPRRSIVFYRVLFGTAPAKCRDDYAKFELDDPPLVLSLEPVGGGTGGTLKSHQLPHARFGRVGDGSAGWGGGHHVSPRGRRRVLLRPANKVLVTDLDNTLWETYTLDVSSTAARASCLPTCCRTLRQRRRAVLNIASPSRFPGRSRCSPTPALMRSAPRGTPNQRLAREHRSAARARRAAA